MIYLRIQLFYWIEFKFPDTIIVNEAVLPIKLIDKPRTARCTADTGTSLRGAIHKEWQSIDQQGLFRGSKGNMGFNKIEKIENMYALGTIFVVRVSFLFCGNLNTHFQNNLVETRNGK